MKFRNGIYLSETSVATIIAVIVIVLIVSLVFVLNSRTAGHNLLGNSTMQTAVSGDVKTLLSNILLSTAAVSRSILAVAFVFSQWVVSSIADKYSPKIVPNR